MQPFNGQISGIVTNMVLSISQIEKIEHLANATTKEHDKKVLLNKRDKLIKKYKKQLEKLNKIEDDVVPANDSLDMDSIIDESVVFDA